MREKNKKRRKISETREKYVRSESSEDSESDDGKRCQEGSDQKKLRNFLNKAKRVKTKLQAQVPAIHGPHLLISNLIMEHNIDA